MHHDHGRGLGFGRRRRRRGDPEAGEDRPSGGRLFGVRRPLRFMAEELGLDDEQVATLARILNELKTERAQAAVDRDRSVARVAAALEAERFDADGAGAALDGRVASAERLKTAVLSALAASHAMLRPEQRARLAYLLRSGALTI